MRLICILAAAAAVAACSVPKGDVCEVSFRFSGVLEPQTRAGELILPDTNDFILRLEDSGGKVLYSGYYGDRPEKFELGSGSYVASVFSREFNVPAFDAPQFGDEVCFMLNSQKQYSVDFNCMQMNSGVRLNIRPGFISDYDGGVLFLTSAKGRVMYSYAETRTAYFHPGAVSLKFLYDGDESVLFTRELRANEILTVNLDSGNGSGESGKGEGMFISVDTSRVWSEYDYVLGSGGGEDPSDALSVAQARGAAGREDVWVWGYVVGGDLTSSSVSFGPVFRSYTNLAIAEDRNEDDREQMMSVSLPAGDVRDALNLVDNPDLIGRRVYVKGDIVSSYFGLPGVKNISEYKL